MWSTLFGRRVIGVCCFLLLSLAACTPEAETVATPTMAVSAATATTAVATMTPTGQPTSTPTSLPPSPTVTVTVAATLSSAMAEASPVPATPTGTIPEPSSTATQCPTATEETWLLRNPEHGYCLLYPIEHEVVKLGELTSISIYAFNSPVEPFVTISVEPAGGRTAEAVADQLAADYKDFSDWIERSTITVGGEEAFSLGKLPGQDFSQAVFFVHDDLLYSLTLFPDVDEPGPKTLHDMVLSSFTFIPRSNEVTEECFEPKANMQLLRDEEQGYCLLYFSEYQVERPNEIETVLAIGSPHNFAEPRVAIEVQDAAGRTAEQIGDEIIAEFEDSAVERTFGPTVGYEAADYLEPVPGQAPGRQVLVVHDGRFYKLTFTPADGNQSDVYTRMEELFWLIISSFRFLPPSSDSCMNDSEFVLDVNVPDGTHFAPGTAFTKTWRLRNSGTCTWDALYRLNFIAGERMDGPESMAIGQTVLPGEVVDISMALIAPQADGTYRAQWQLVAPDGMPFGANPYVEIVVP